MTPREPGWERVREVLADALELDAGQRDAFVDRACADDAAIGSRVRRLLARVPYADQFLSTPPTVDGVHPPGPGSEPDRDPATRPDVIDEFTLRRVIASGGAGTVFEAEQSSPQRTVALKLLRSDASSPELARRFARESEILGQLQHPSIAQVHASGVHRHGVRQQPWIAMELVAGAETIVDWCASRDLEASDRIALLLDVCSAVQHGHDRGIVHRDLKPSNLLVGADGRAKVIDFGVARTMDDGGGGDDATLQTRQGDVIGTLPYMSPEQCGDDPSRVGPPADVYALGVILFELLAGRRPILLGGLDMEAAIRAIREAPPVRLRDLQPGAGTDLDAITAVALAKDPRDRYATVRAFADDLRRVLAHEPIVARPPGPGRQLQLWMRRHRGPAIATAIVGLTLIAGATTSTIFAIQADHLASVASDERDTQQAIVSRMESILSAPDPHNRGEAVTVLDLLATVASDLDDGADDPPLVAATIRRMIGATYLALGRDEPAIVELSKAADLFAGRDPAAEVLARNQLGVTWKRLGNDAEAARSFRQAVDVIETLPADSELRDDAVFGNLATVLGRLGRPAEALVMAERVYEIRRTRADLPPILVCASLRQIAELRRLTGATEAALEAQREALALAERITEPSHPIRPAILGELAMMLDRVDRRDEALGLHRAAWRLAGEHRRPGSRDWIIRIETLVDALEWAGQTDEARETLDLGIAQVSAGGEGAADVERSLRTRRDALGR